MRATNHFLIEFKVWHCKSGQKPMIGELASTGFEPATIVTLDGHSISLLSKLVTLSPSVSTAPNPNQKSCFVPWKVVNIEIHSWSQYRELVSRESLAINSPSVSSGATDKAQRPSQRRG